MIEQIARAIDAMQAECRKPAHIEVGEAQARAIADELNEGWYLQQRLGLFVNTAPKPVGWEHVVRGDGWLFGVPIRGVESPDYLNVVAEDAA